MARKTHSVIDRESRYARVVLREEQEPRKGRGRHPAIGDDDLARRRDSLVDLFETAWGQIGWTLRNARTPADFLRAFGPIVGRSRPRYPFIHLWQETALRSTPIEMRLTRQSSEASQAEVQELLEAIPRQTESVQEARYALSEAGSRTKLVVEVKAELERREAELIRLRAESVRAEERFEELKKMLGRQEAYFAQSQLSAFLKGRRFRYTPRNVANVIAGLPFIGCRESYLRCRKIPYEIAPHFHYLAFEGIKQVLLRGGGLPIEEEFEIFRGAIRRLLARHRFQTMQRETIVESLRREYPSLRDSMETLMRIPGNSRALPYRIIAAYVASRQQPSTPLDRVLVGRGLKSRHFQGQKKRPPTIPCTGG